MEIVEKIRAEIQLHELELERLRTALGVIEQYAGKTVKPAPMLTIRKQVEKPAPKAGTPVKGNGALSLKGMILKLLHAQDGETLSIKQIMPEALATGRKKQSVYGALDALVKDRLIVKVSGGNYSLPSKQKAGAPQAIEPGITAEGQSEAA